MVAVGETDFEPRATGVVVPIPLSKKSVAAFVEVHESVEEAPEVIDVGEAERVQTGTGGGGGGVTVIVAEQVADPPGPVTVAI